MSPMPATSARSRCGSGVIATSPRSRCGCPRGAAVASSSLPGGDLPPLTRSLGPRSRSRVSVALAIGLFVVLGLLGGRASAQATRGIQHGVRPARYVIRNATVVEGNGTPASGPYDIVIEGNTLDRKSTRLN